MSSADEQDDACFDLLRYEIGKIYNYSDNIMWNGLKVWLKDEKSPKIQLSDNRDTTVTTRPISSGLTCPGDETLWIFSGLYRYSCDNLWNVWVNAKCLYQE